MSCLPRHGRVECTRCFSSGPPVEFDATKRVSSDESWRITSNPLAWGNVEPEILALGFSKGPTQAGALASEPHDRIAYKGSRSNVGKILAHIGAVSEPPDGDFGGMVDRLIADRNGRFHFGSLVRCTVERFDEKDRCWKSSGGGMLDKFMYSDFGMEVAGNCAERFLGELPARTKLVVMFGLGAELNYVRESRNFVEEVWPGIWWHVNEVAYTEGSLTFVHVEHFASQGRLIPDWLGENDSPRAEYGRLAREAAQAALGA